MVTDRWILASKKLNLPKFDGDILTLYAEHSPNHLIIPTPPTNAESGVTHP